MNTATMGRSLLLGGLLAAAAMPSTGSAQIGMPMGREARTIRVSGIGEVRADPDLATVQFAVETTGATAQEAGEGNADRMDAVIRALLAAGVTREDIATSGYSLFPEYAEPPRGSNEAPRIRGYRAMNQVSVETRRLDRIGALIDAGLAAGANRLNGVSFEVRNSDAAEAAALEMAVREARAAAQTIASTLGVTLGAVLDASTSTEPVRPLYRAMARDMEMAMPAAMPTPIEPGQQTIRAVASVVFEIE